MTSGKPKINTSRIKRELTDKVPLYYARKYGLLPVHGTGSQVVVIAVNGNNDPFTLGQISDQLNVRLVPYTLKKYPPDTVREAIDELYSGKRMRFGELLLVNNIISEPQLSEVVSLQRENPSKRLGTIVKDLGYASESDLQKIYAEQLGYKFVDIETSNFLDLNLISSFPEQIIKEHRVLPLPQGDSYEYLHLLTWREIDAETLESMRQEAGVKKLNPILTIKEELENAIDSVFRRLTVLKSRDKTLGSLLIERGLITEEQLNKALEEQRRNNRKLGEVLIEHRVLPERVIMEVVAEKINARYLRELPSVLEPDLKQKLTKRFAFFNKVVPIGIEEGKMKVAMTDPADTNLINTLRSALGMQISPVLASEKQIIEAIKRLYREKPADVAENTLVGDRKSGSTRLKLQSTRESTQSEMEGEALYNTERIINIVNNILVEAVLQGASDVHLTPSESSLSLKYRIDGSIRKVADFGYKDKDNIIARIKILSDMRIDARHIPQSGRIVSTIDSRNIDFRVSTLPTQHGENIVLRILDSSKMLDSDLSKLGMPDLITDDFLDECERSQGIVLVTGPTGSGKTTTLYHVLNHLHHEYPFKNISTIENPIEYVIEGIVQSEINEARGLDYAKILKEKLRQDPDIIMVGEIRNKEEGDLAFTAALTGHMVLSTLHTNDGASTIRRLVEMGLEPYNVSTGINCILSQRLARRVCTHCKTEYTPTERDVRKVRKSMPDFEPDDYTFYSGFGCDFCNEGFKGRIGIYELLTVDATVKELISRNATDTEIRNAAVRNGMKTLRMAGLDLAMQGVISLQEVLSVTDVMH